MRTTLTLSEDVAAKARRAMMKTGLPFKDVINQSLRVGLDEILSPPQVPAYRTEPSAMGLRSGLSYDNIAELLAVAEGEAHL